MQPRALGVCWIRGREEAEGGGQATSLVWPSLWSAEGSAEKEVQTAAATWRTHAGPGCWNHTAGCPLVRTPSAGASVRSCVGPVVGWYRLSSAFSEI